MTLEDVLSGRGVRATASRALRGRRRRSRDGVVSSCRHRAPDGGGARARRARRPHAAASQPHRLSRSTAPAGIGDPRGLAGTTLGADLHTVTADEAPLRNLMHVVERSYLSACGPRRRRPTPARWPRPPRRSAGSASSASTSAPAQRRWRPSPRTSAVAATSSRSAATTSPSISPTPGDPTSRGRANQDAIWHLVRAASDDHETISYALAGEEDGGRCPDDQGASSRGIISSACCVSSVMLPSGSSVPASASYADAAHGADGRRRASLSGSASLRPTSSRGRCASRDASRCDGHAGRLFSPAFSTCRRPRSQVALDPAELQARAGIGAGREAGGLSAA